MASKKTIEIRWDSDLFRFEFPDHSLVAAIPEGNESAAISYKPKTAALFYDRIWCMSEDIVPAPIRCWGATEGELNIPGFWGFINMLPKELRKDLYGDIIEAIMNDLNKPDGPMSKYLGPHREVREVIACYFNAKHHVSLIPIHDTLNERDIYYKPGEMHVIISALHNLEIPDEQKLTWKQVSKFREDSDAIRKYRRFIHWLDKEMVDKPQAYIEDEIARKLEDYTWSLKKHGIETIIGNIEEALDSKTLLSSAAIGGSLSLSGYDIWGAIATGGLLVGKVSVKLVRTMISRQDIKCGPNSEISWVYNVKRLSK